MLYRFIIPLRFLKIALMAIIIANLLYLLGTWTYHSIELPEYSSLRRLNFQSDLSSENNLAAWYSSILLFLSAIMAFVCFIIDRLRLQKGFSSYLNIGWLILALIFAVLSFDELGSVHEYIGDYQVFKNVGKVFTGKESSGWFIFMALVGLVSIFMVAFGFLRLWVNKLSLLLLFTGVVLYLSNPFQEIYEIESYRAALIQNSKAYERPVFFLLLEEGTEIFGSLFFLIALALYAFKFTGNTFSSIILDLKTSKMVGFINYFLILFSFAFLIVRFVSHEVVASNQIGTPKNWFVSVLAFLVAIFSLNAFKNAAANSFLIKIMLITTFIMGLIFSGYYGSNIYEYEISLLSKASLLKEIFDILLSIVSIIIAFFLFLSANNLQIRIGSLVWSLIIVSLISNTIFAAEIAFVAFCGLFYTLILYTIFKNQYPELKKNADGIK